MVSAGRRNGRCDHVSMGRSSRWRLPESRRSALKGAIAASALALVLGLWAAAALADGHPVAAAVASVEAAAFTILAVVCWVRWRPVAGEHRMTGAYAERARPLTHSVPGQ